MYFFNSLNHFILRPRNLCYFLAVNAIITDSTIPLSAEIVQLEQQLNTMLPNKRLEAKPPATLLAAAAAWSAAVWQAAEKAGPMPLTTGQIQQGETLARNPVFICGVHRSGTTLVRNLLDGHPQLCVLPSEGTFYTNQEVKLQQLPSSKRASYLGMEWLRRLANPINQAPYWLLGRSTETASPYVNFARYVLAWWQVLPQKPGTQWPHMAIVLAYAACTNNLSAGMWVDKTPTNERFLQRIWQEMPNARIIHVVREPLATLSSRKVMEPSITLRAALRSLKTSYTIAAGQAELSNERFYLLKYEELCQGPEAVINRLSTFLNIHHSEVLKNATVGGVAAKANSSFNAYTSAGEILRSTHQKGNAIFSPEETRLISAYLGNEARALGYSLPKIPRLNGIGLKIKHRLFI